MPNRRFVKKDYLDQKKLLRTAVTGIINLSDYTLSTPEKTLLSRGLSFCPQPTQVDTLDIQRDTLLFNRRLRLKHLFRDQNNTNRDIFTNPTGWTPPVGKSPTLDTYINVTTTEILEHHPAPRKCMNLSNTELAALKTLRSNSNLVIKPADKGGAIVLMNKEDYIQEGLRQLSDPNFYREIPRDHTNKNTTEIHKFLLSMKTKKLLPDAHVNFIMPRNCRTPLFYLLPKIHKKNNPGRPIVSACDSPTEKISMYLDTFLQPLAQKTDSYIKDTTHFLQNLNKLGKINKDALLVTIDVTSLYTNIPHRDGIRASKEALDRRTTQEPKTWVLLRLLHFILTKTAFKFDNKFYEQISGTTIGTKCAPSYAIIFMRKLKNDFLSTVRQQPLIWWRYIDDIFMIWPHSYQELCFFLTALNSFHETIKFTSEISDTAVNFLDVTVKKDNTGKIHTLLYTKPTDAHLYLHYSSFHPKHQKKSLPYSQALRLRRICSRTEYYEKAASDMLKHFTNRGYPTHLVRNAIQKALNIDRNSLLLPKTDPTNKKITIPFILTYNPCNPPISDILKKYTRLLHLSEDLKQIADSQCW